MAAAVTPAAMSPWPLALSAAPTIAATLPSVSASGRQDSHTHPRENAPLESSLIATYAIPATHRD